MRIRRSKIWESRTSRRTISVSILICLMLLLEFLVTGGIFSAADHGTMAADAPVPTETEVQDKDYSRFTHNNAFHSRLPCLLCHQRNDNSARMGFPGRGGHTPCIGCHKLQFQDSGSRICSICHTNAESGALKRFPGLRSFGMTFDHGRHRRVNCAICHKPAQRGVALSIPSRIGGHTTCFQCHSSSSPHLMSSCSVCHKPGRPVRTPETARAFSVNFSHALHAGKRSLTCTSCHTIRPGAGRGRQVSAPTASMHFAPSRSVSCATCHNGERAFGTNDFSNCKRCHQEGNSFRFRR